ncbi:MAG: prenyltransferase/squalene oxidase repeat-containing protein [Pirellulaceae bacterium]
MTRGEDEFGRAEPQPQSAAGSEPVRIWPVPPAPPIDRPPLPPSRPGPPAARPPEKPAVRPSPAIQIVPDIRRSTRHAEGTPAPAGPLSIDAPEPDPLQQDDLKTAAIKTAPAWLVSFVFHTLLIIVLGLIYVAQKIPQTIALDVSYAESLGAQLEDDQLQGTTIEPNDVKDPSLSLDKLPADDPLARPPALEPRLTGFLPTDSLTAPSIGLALTGREAGMKNALLAKFGGTATTQAAVGRALEWLKRNQRRDGSWSLKGPFTSGAMDENKTSATAMALLAFQGAGNTHETGDYLKEVENGWRALLKLQDEEGNFYQGGNDEQRLYSQAQAMIAVCEIYGMTQASRFRQPAQKAIDYAVKIQASEGGWRYRPGVDSDTSVTGWFVMGLQSGLMAGLDVPSPTLQRVSKYLDSVAVNEGSFYRYQPIRQGFSPAMTAEGLLCRQYLGWKQDDPRLSEGAEYLLQNQIDWADRDVYYWYYATQVLHHLEGDYWEKWNRVMRDVVPKNQVLNGKEAGSWDPEGDQWGGYGGRLYVTCLSTYMLEVYYRHLPIYQYRMQ